MYSDSIEKQEIGIVLSDGYKGQMVKVCIPALTPDLKTDKAYNVRQNKPTASNIVSGNANKLDLRRYNKSNYIEIKATHKVFTGDKVYISILGTDKNANFEMAGEYNGK